MFTLSSTDCLSRCNVTAVHQDSMRSLLEQSSLDLLPGVPAAFVCVHAKQDAQPTCQAAGLLLQEIGLRLSFETFKMNKRKQVFTAQHIKVFEFLSVKPKEARNRLCVTVIFDYMIKSKGEKMEPMFSRPTCFPQQGSLLVVGVESLGKVVRVQQAIQQLKKLLRGQVAIHSLVLDLHGDVYWTHSIPLRKDKWMMHYFVTQKQNTAAFLRRSGRKQLFVPEQLQSSPHLPSYWWRGKRRCCRWSGSAPAARRTLWVKPRINAAPGSLWDMQGGEVNQKMYAGKKHTGVKNPWVKWQTDLFGSYSLDRPRSRLRLSCTDSADDSLSQLCRSCWWNAGHQSGTGCPMTSGKLSPGSKVNRGTAIMQELYV